MKLTTTMIGLEDGTASLGLFGEIDEEAGLRPPHVQITVTIASAASVADLRATAIRTAIDALDQARGALEAELK